MQILPLVASAFMERTEQRGAVPVEKHARSSDVQPEQAELGVPRYLQDILAAASSCAWPPASEPDTGPTDAPRHGALRQCLVFNRICTIVGWKHRCQTQRTGSRSRAQCSSGRLQQCDRPAV